MNTRPQKITKNKQKREEENIYRGGRQDKRNKPRRGVNKRYG